MPPPLARRQKDSTALSASPDSSPGSNPRAFSFGDLGRPRASSPRLLPPIKDPDPSELELDADDILESSDIDSLEVAAAGIASFAAPHAEPAPSGFEIGEVEAFVEVAVEGTVHVTAPVPVSVSVSVPVTVPVPVHAPVSMRVDYTSPAQSTLIGMPAAPITSPLPLEESVAAPPVADHTQEMKGDTLAKVAQQASFLDGDIPEETQVIEQQAEQQASTQVLVRSQMPLAIQGALRGAPSRGRQSHTPPPTSVHTPLAATAAAWPNGRHAPGPASRAPVAASLAPVAVDPRVRPAMASVPAVAAPPRPVKSNGLLIGGLVFAAAALIGVVGVGGYLASRTLSDKAEAITTAPAPVAAAPAAPVADPVAAAEPVVSPVAASPAAAAPVAAAGIDGSALPSAPAKGASVPAPRSVTAPTGGAAATHAVTISAPPPAGRAGAPLPPPGAVAATPPAATGGAAALPPPPSKPAPAAAAPAAASTTGSVNVDPKLRAVVVDGAFRRVNDGVLTLTCGAHRIKVGMNDPQTVNVPCGGSVSL